MNAKRRWDVGYFLLAIALVYWMRGAWIQTQTVAEIPYSQFQALLSQKRVQDLVIDGQRIRGTLSSPGEGEKPQFVTTRVDLELARELSGAGVRYRQATESTWLRDLLSWILPLLFFFGFWMYLGRRMGGGLGGGMLTVGKSKAKVYAQTDIQTTFQDVAGVDEAKAELKEVVEFLKDPKTYGRLGARMPKGILLVGPPGTGKTLLARAVAGEAGVPFFSMSGSEFVEMFVGVGAARVRDLFEQARKQAPCIIFIDELDSLGRARVAGPSLGGHDEKEQTLNQLLAELDGFDSKGGVILLAATNRPETLDPALLRAGRFDRQVLVDRPDKKGRVDILRVHVRKVTMEEGLALEEVAGLTPGFTGADLANLVNEAALVATRRSAERISLDDFTQAIERIVAGLEKKNRLLNPKERKIVAYHEMGHALVASRLGGNERVHKISIIPRGIGSLGYTIQRPTEDRYLMTEHELCTKMAVLMGGRAAEKLIFGHRSTGAADDIARATDIARSMVERYGMSPAVGPVALEKEGNLYLGLRPGGGFEGQTSSEEFAQARDRAVKEWVQGAEQTAIELLTQERAVLEKGAEALLAQETLNEQELAQLLGSAPASN